MTYTTEVRLKAGYQDSQDEITPTQIILHSLANGWNWDSGVRWLENPNNALESNYAIRKDGHRLMLVPDGWSADANYLANVRAISVETDSDVAAVEPWTDDQVESIIELLVDMCLKWSIPPVLTPAWDAPGLGWHIMWGTPGKWTPVAKSCPGAARIAQFKNVIVPRVATAVAAGGITPPPLRKSRRDKHMNVVILSPSRPWVLVDLDRVTYAFRDGDSGNAVMAALGDPAKRALLSDRDFDGLYAAVGAARNAEPSEADFVNLAKAVTAAPTRISA